MQVEDNLRAGMTSRGGRPSGAIEVRQRRVSQGIGRPSTTILPSECPFTRRSRRPDPVAARTGRSRSRCRAWPLDGHRCVASLRSFVRSTMENPGRETLADRPRRLDIGWHDELEADGSAPDGRPELRPPWTCRPWPFTRSQVSTRTWSVVTNASPVRARHGRGRGRIAGIDRGIQDRTNSTKGSTPTMREMRANCVSDVFVLVLGNVRPARVADAEDRRDVRFRLRAGLLQVVMDETAYVFRQGNSLLGRPAAGSAVISAGRMICVRCAMMAPSYHHLTGASGGLAGRTAARAGGGPGGAGR